MTRRELFDNVWSGRVVSDTSLSNHIKSARKVLGDDGKTQKVIKTIHGRGYQFIAEFEVSTDEFPISEVPNASIDGDEKSIAVLAFTDLSPKRDQEYFSDGLSEELINLLAKMSDLKVISRTSSFSFKGKNATIEEIGRQLGVSHVLEGSLRKADNRLRITTQLIKISDDSHLWSKTFTREMDDIFKIQDEIARAVSSQLKLTLFGDPVKSTLVDSVAYTLFLEAKYLYQQYTVASVARAEKVIGESIALSSEYAPAWNLLGAIVARATYNLSLKPRELGAKQLAAAVKKAIEIDPEYPFNYALKAELNIWNWEFSSAEQNIQKALQLENDNSVILHSASNIAMSLGRIKESIGYLKRAIELDPLHHHLQINLCINYLMVDQLFEAEQAIKKYSHFLPDAEIHHELMSTILLEQGKPEQAKIEAEQEPDEFWRLQALIRTATALGEEEESLELLHCFEDKYADADPSIVATLYAFRKDKEATFKWLDQALIERDPGISEAINFNVFSFLRHESRWKRFLAKLGLPDSHWLIEE